MSIALLSAARSHRFDPASLAAGGGKLVVIDPSVMSAQFQDSAGTTVCTAAGQPVGLSQDQSGTGSLGAEKVVNSTFASSTGWTLPSGATISTTLNCANVTGYVFRTDGSFVAGQPYQVVYTISAYTSGTVQSFLNAQVGGPLGVVTSSAGTVTQTITATATDGVLGFLMASFTGTITILSIKAVFSGNLFQATNARRAYLAGNGRPRLLFQGTTLSSAPIDLSGTSVVTVVMSVRKWLDSSAGIAIEFGPDSGSTAGTFAVTAPNSSGTYGFTGFGTALGSYNASTYNAPTADVIDCVFDISGALLSDEIKPVINGLIPSLSVASAGPMGTGNFTSKTLNIGSRADFTFPASIALYRMIIYGGAITAAQLAKARAWCSRGSQTVAASVGDSVIAAYNGNFSACQFIDCTEAQIAHPGDTIAQQKTAWIARTDKASYNVVVVMIGHNDLDTTVSTTAQTITAIQDLITTIKGNVSVPVYICTLSPCKARLITLYGATNGALSYQKWLDVNTAITGGGGSPITNVDGRISSHTTTLNDGSGNLASTYNSGDDIHPNDLGRNVIGTAAYTAFGSLLS